MSRAMRAATITGFLRVLLIDHNVEERRRVRDLLQENGNFHVACARDAHEASLLIANGVFDAAVVDGETWSQSGVDLLRRASRDVPMPAVLVLTGCSNAEASTRIRAGRPDIELLRGYLADGPALAERVITAVAASRSGRQGTILRWLERDARTDRLTGLYNEAGFREALAIACDRAAENGATVGLILMRVAGISSSRGERLLQRAAQGLARSVRGADVAAHSGHAELAVIVEGAGIDLLKVISRRIAHQIERLDETDWPHETPLDVEFAFASLRRPSAESLYEAARRQFEPEVQSRPRALFPVDFFEDPGPSVA